MIESYENTALLQKIKRRENLIMRLQAVDAQIEHEKRKVARREIRNGMRKPRPDSDAGQLWTFLDLHQSVHKCPPNFNQITEYMLTNKLNTANARTYYANWRKFNGITGRI
jgi:hypothetical protein